MHDQSIKTSGQPLSGGVTRRTVLKGMGTAAGAVALGAPFVRPSYAETVLRISNFGGFFEEAFAKDVYPAFSKATGIKVQSIGQSSGAEFLVQLAQANKAGSAPMDICCSGQVEFRRGQLQGLWRPWDDSKIPNLKNYKDAYVGKSDKGIDGVGAMAWFITLIVNPEEFETPPDSWTELWKDRPSAWGLQGSGTSVLLEITAATHFGGTAVLDTKEGIDKVIAKIAELKPNVKLWWQDEGSMQTAYQNEEVVGGMYYHDVAMIMRDGGTPLTSVFPKEGGLMGYNFWCRPAAAPANDAAELFADWACSPEAHQLASRFVGTTPLLDRSMLDLTDEEYGRVASDTPPIYLYPGPKVEHADYITEQFIKMMTA